jgi:ABC-type cobalamin/Fe3+-siderophores transport system ATPase subunit
MAPMLHATGLRFQYGQRVVFGDLSFTTNAGDMVALLGANGTGKTTLLNLAAGLLHPTAGQLSLDGRELNHWKRQELSRFVALVPQLLEMPFAFRVEEIVAQGRMPYAGRFRGLSKRDRDVIERAMEATDVTGLRDRVYSELSGGERQRVKLAIGLAQEPKLMLLDEPTQHLDIGRQIELVALLRRLNENGITIIAAIHDLNVARENFATAMLLTNGSCLCGPTPELLRPDLLEIAFAVDAAALEAYTRGSQRTARL